MRPFLRPSWLPRTSFLAWLPRTTPHRVPRRIATTSARNAAPVDLPQLVVSPGSQHHNSMTSFLEYAKRTKLELTSTTAVGTMYEYMSAQVLMRLGFSLLRIGRRSDAGIDLIGHWVLAPLREPLPVIIQCKSLKKLNVNPSHVRELEGSFKSIPPNWRNKDVLGLLVTTRKATTGVLKAVSQSQWPMGFVLISREGLIEQFVWNRAAAQRGLQGVGVTVRHTPRALLDDPEEGLDEDTIKASKKSQAKFKNAGTRKDIQLTWMGSPIFPDRDNLDQETLRLVRQIPPSEDDAPVPVVAEVEKRPRGRPKGSTMDKLPLIVAPNRVGRPRQLLSERAPSPRGGQLPRVIKEPVSVAGRPFGSKTKHRASKEPEEPPKPTKSTKPTKAPRPRVKVIRASCRKRPGRPPGSKDKTKVSDGAG
jgi:hypothetical protein